MPTSAASAPAEALRVLIVDDSAVVRTLTSRWIEEEPDLELAGIGRNGREAVERAGRVRPDVILLDVEMPDMDGITALPLLLKAAPNAMVLMASALTRRNAEMSIRALALGASDVIAKPGQGVDQATYRVELLAKVRALGEHLRRRARAGSPATRVRAAVMAVPT
ncbi:response regulator, partial [Methylopila musalis]